MFVEPSLCRQACFVLFLNYFSMYTCGTIAGFKSASEFVVLFFHIHICSSSQQNVKWILTSLNVIGFRNMMHKLLWTKLPILWLNTLLNAFVFWCTFAYWFIFFYYSSPFSVVMKDVLMYVCVDAIQALWECGVNMQISWQWWHQTTGSRPWPPCLCCVWWAVSCSCWSALYWSE